VDGRRVSVGSLRMMQSIGLESTELEMAVERLQSEAKTAMLVAVDGKVQGIIAVADTVKDGSIEAIRGLHELGLKVAMITGDNRRTAEAIAAQAGIAPDHVLAEVLPEHKAEEVAKLQARGLTVAMVGDGINDAPALAQADVGIAVGSGTDIAMDSADIVLMKNDLRDVPTAIMLSRQVIRNIHQNLFWAFFYNFDRLAGSSRRALSFFQITLNPMIASLAMAFSSVTVVSNSLRLRRLKI